MAVSGAEVFVAGPPAPDARAPRRGARVLGGVVEDAVHELAVVRGGVLDIGHVLEPALDLEGADAGLDQHPQVGALVVVLHRQQVLVVGDDAAGLVFQRVGQAAGLGAFAAVGAAPGVGVADVALAAVGHAQCAVDEEFQGGVGTGGDPADLLQAQLARQDDLREADVAQETCLLQGADVGLGAGMQLDGWQVELQQAHVLHDQGIGARVVELPGQASRLLQFIVAQDGVEGDEDLGEIAVGMRGQACDVADVVAGTGPSAEGRAADIHRVGAVIDRLDAEIGVLGGSEQFDGGGGLGNHGWTGRGRAGLAGREL